MFSLNNTEKIFEGKSKLRLKLEYHVLNILSVRGLGKLLLWVLRYMPGFFGQRFMLQMFSCHTNSQDLKEVVKRNYQKGVFSIVYPIHSLRRGSWDKVLNVVKSDCVGLNRVIIDVENYIDARILSMVSANALMNSEDRRRYQQFLVRLEDLCSTAEVKGKSVVIFTTRYHLVSTVRQLAVNLMKKFNRENVTVYFLFQLCLAGAFNDIVEQVHTSLKENYKPGIAITKYFVSDFSRMVKGIGKSGVCECNSTSVIKRTYRDVTKYIMNNADNLSAIIVSHNPDNLLYLTSLMVDLGVGMANRNISLSQRFGMAPHVSYNLAENGFFSEVIIPYGDPNEVLIYLRRLYDLDPSLQLIFSEICYAIKLELKNRKLKKHFDYES